MINVDIFYQNKLRISNNLSQSQNPNLQKQVIVFVESNNLFTPRFYYIFGKRNLNTIT